MNADQIQYGYDLMTRTSDFPYPALGWYFSRVREETDLAFKKKRWTCMFMLMKLVMKTGRPLSFSRDYGNACVGPAEYFGYAPLIKDGGWFIAEKERFKKTCALAQCYYRDSCRIVRPAREPYLNMQLLSRIPPDRKIEVVSLFPDITGLCHLSVLSGYDREACEDNVITPFASGCQSVFTRPFYEGLGETPRSVIGLMDPLVRHFVPKDMISFSVPANRFMEMADNIPGSFLDPAFKNPMKF